jgi:membrane protease YdiL (CAAX protease family)
MANIEARPSGPLVHPRAIARDIIGFVRHPELAGQPFRWSHKLLIALAMVVLIDLGIDGALYAALTQLDESVVDLPDPIDFTLPLQEAILGTVMLAAIVEEALFRGWLTGKKASLRFAACGVVGSLGLMIAADERIIDKDHQLYWFVIAGSLLTIIAGLLQWLATRKRDTAIPAWFTRNYRKLIWGSAIVFGLYHLPNYEPVSDVGDIIVVLPETIGALFLTYSRVRFGLCAAMLHHATYNAVWILLDRAIL